MKNGAKKAKKYFGLGFLITGAAVGAGAAAMALLRRQKREQVYHEAELKAMNELDDLMAENESACAGCTPGDGACCNVDGQISISDAQEDSAPAPQDEPSATDDADKAAGEGEPSAEDDEPQA